jgi:hypothetical protein
MHGQVGWSGRVFRFAPGLRGRSPVGLHFAHNPFHIALRTRLRIDSGSPGPGALGDGFG